MKIRYFENMTNEMKEVVDLTMNPEEVRQEIELCSIMYDKAIKAYNVELPIMLENGNQVVWGAKKEILDLAEYWLQRKYLVERYVGRKE